MEERILEYYTEDRILAVYHGEEAWKKEVPIRWPQPQVRAAVRRRFRNQTMDQSMLVVFVSPKTGPPEMIGAHYYIDKRIPGVSQADGDHDNIMRTDAPFSAVSLPDAPKLLKKLTKDLE